MIYRSRFQRTVSMISTEAKYIAAAESGKLVLYMRSMLNELGIEQEPTTTLYEDNDVVIAMANYQRPAQQTRHIDIRNFPLLDWVKTDQLILSTISTHDKPEDGTTKALGP